MRARWIAVAATAGSVVLAGLMGAARPQQQVPPSEPSQQQLTPPVQGNAGQGQQQQFSDPDDVGQASVVLTTPPPETRLEQLLQKRGAVVVRGYTEAGSAAGEDDAGVRVMAVEVKSVPDGERQTGLAIEVHHGNNVVVSYLDADEVPTAIATMGDMARLNNSATNFAEFDARYHGRGGFQVLNRTVNGARLIAIRSTQTVGATGTVAWATAYFRAQTLSQLQEQMTKGVELLQKAER